MKNKIKVAIIGSRGYPYVYSGYETLVKELSERLVSKGHEVRVYCHKPLFKRKPRYVNGIELIYIPSIETKLLSQFVNSFLSFIHICFSKIDIVLVVNTANGPFGLITKIFRKKTFINVDGIEWLRPKWKGLGSLYFKISTKLSILFFDSIITDSIEMKKLYKKNFKMDSINIAYGSTMIKSVEDDFIKKLNLRKNDYYLIVGRLIPDNNSLLIIKSFLKANSSKKLVVVGDVPYKDNYSEKVKSIINKKVIKLGYVKCQRQLSSLYKNCFCYVHGHEYGGTNPTMINALDFNCNIIALNTKFNREMLDEKYVLFFEKDEFSIINILKIFEKDFSQISLKNKNYKLPERYNWEIISKKYLKIFLSKTSQK